MTRGYESPGREVQARETRRRILAAAQELLLGAGYSQMTIAQLARTAGVSAQTVYNSVGGKAEVVKAVYDVLIAGDDESVAMSDRPEFHAMIEAVDLEQWAYAYAAWSRVIMQRVGAFWGALLEHGPGGDPVLEQLVVTVEHERRRGNEQSIAGLSRRGLLPAQVARRRLVDAVWVLTAPEVFDRLVRRSGWSPAAYERWLAGQLIAALS